MFALEERELPGALGAFELRVELADSFASQCDEARVSRGGQWRLAFALLG
jgi:hypothetical protein